MQAKDFIKALTKAKECVTIITQSNDCTARKAVADMKDFIMKLVKDFNEYSELVALNYSKMKEGKCDESTLQWNRGNLNRIEDYLKQLAESTEGVNLKWECKEHTFGFDDWKRQLEYKTVRVVFDN